MSERTNSDIRLHISAPPPYQIIHGEDLHDSLGRKDVFRPSMLDSESGRNEGLDKKWEEAGNLTEGLDKKRRSPGRFEDKKTKKKKKVDDDQCEKKFKQSVSNKRRAEKERQDYLKQLRADSQKLLRETRDAEFNPIPLVQKSISSVLDKIRQRKLEVLKKCSISISIDDNDGSERELMVDDKRVVLGEDIAGNVEKVEGEEAVTCPAVKNTNLDASHIRGSNGAANYSSCESIPSSMAMAPESELAFRAPIDDTQELFSDSETTDTKDELGNEKANSPLEEVFTPSTLVMNLKLDSAPPDDVSSDEEDNDKENTDPHLHGSTNSPSPPNGDPLKAFVDVEAEVEDDSDNDFLHFQDHEEEDDDDDAEELHNMIASEYEEKPIDRERREELHQQWLEQQDVAGMDNLLQKLNCGSKLRKTISIDREEDEEEKETDNESDYETEDVAPSGAVRVNLKKFKQMIPHMFADKDDAYVSSDDEEIEKRLAKQCLFDKSEEQSTFLSPAEDESCREVFSLIKKLNVVPETKRRGRIPSFMDTSLIGRNTSISSKSSFLGRASNNSVPSSHKHGSGKVRSFIFGRDDSNCRTSNSMSEDSSETIQREIQPPKIGSAKFKGNTQNKYSTFNTASQKSSTSLLEILRRSSLQEEHCVQNTVVQQTESVFAAFKLAKKPIKAEGRV
ncbi:hypothetical protein L6164_015368 [Bauhinia variegata]|uniref:Uncharacterized protein n=1 Tax=Bauhinia variegata TaxID=167791 RepID=A0ACB9NLM2_BAUVA|nr:hypothetical protein L6164_015368 [Bauhinia variegata]